MNITVLGGGHGCYAAAAELSDKGHQVCLWRRNAQAFADITKAGGITLKDFRGERLIAISPKGSLNLCSDLKEAVESAELVVIPLPATAHLDLANRVAPHLKTGQVVFLPPGTFGSFIFAKAMVNVNNKADVAFAETGTLPYLARVHGRTKVVISSYGLRLPTGVLPSCLSKHGIAILRQAYPAVEEIEDALSGALMNAGPILHPPLILMNAGPLEYFDTWDIHNEGTQASIRRVTTCLDNERIAIREALSYSAPHFPLVDHYSSDGEEWMYGKNAHERLTDSGDWREDIELSSHRYMLEDTQLGLSLLVSLGRWSKVPTPVAQGLLSIASAVIGRDLYREGRTLENLGLADYSRTQMQQLLTDGVNRQ